VDDSAPLGPVPDRLRGVDDVVVLLQRLGGAALRRQLELPAGRGALDRAVRRGSWA
jgi:hypothetical protein